MIREKNDNIDLIKGELSPSAARASFNGMLEGMTQELNLEKLRGFEKESPNLQIETLQGQIDYLKMQKRELNERLLMAEQLGCNVQMCLSFKLNLSK